MNRLAFDCEIKLAGDAADTAIGTIEGYASVHDLLDRGGDIVAKGAFKASLAEWKKRKALPAMLWQHDSYQPVGVWSEIAEDDRGLRVKGELVLDVPQASAARSLILAGAVKGLSIGYRTLDYDIDRLTGVRTLKKVDLWEISLVTFPMLPEAQIDGVKGDFDAQAWERAFRDEGLSNRDAKAAVAAARKLVRHGDVPDAGDESKELLMSLRRASAVVGGAG